ncbi:NADPH-dependent FMN reductase [Pseudoduganella namucuonensis]|uniref:Chromate reductase n=1 Tax=Pseudoduganella namucuonensis TaxID=1035707 RepID=A0A1I7LA45_9BURK|nr:NAD(P)H-dependent oxidoreductase [Pseudoduganella namucuonensis]SFV06570.1 chromate reductase [Pseudoduganella namucuonensis]
MSAKKIAVLIGSLRKESLNRKFAHELIALAPATLEFEVVEIGDLALYNQDLDDAGAPPAAWTAFRDKLARVDGVLFVTPEYNRAMPASIKNAIDVGSRPWGKSIWDGKAAGVVTVSPGAVGGFGANHNVRQSLVALNVATMPAPEAYIGSAEKLLGEDGKVSNDQTRQVLTKFITAFAAWVGKNAPSA